MSSAKNVLLHLREQRAERTMGRKNALKAVAGRRKIRVGVWDLGAWLGTLPRLLDAMTAAQDQFEFFTIEATVPVGMIRQAPGVLAWAEAAMGHPVPESEAKIGYNSMVEDDFYSIGEKVLEETDLDYLVGVTPSMIAFAKGDEVAWDYLSSSDGKKLLLVSAFDLRKFAAAVNRHYDVFLGTLILGQLLVTRFYPKLGFHEDCGCLFDFNDDRTRLKVSVQDLKIEPGCLGKMPKEFQVAGQAIVDVLRKYPQ